MESSKFFKIYKFPWSKTCNCICMGNAAFFNHSETPNARVSAINTINLTKTFIATKKIEKDIEITIRYGNNVNFDKDETINNR